MNQDIHKPVLLEQVLSVLSPQEGESYLDLTAGYGGHAQAIGSKLGKSGAMRLVDRDIKAVDFLRQQFNDSKQVEIIHSDYLAASKTFYDSGERFDVILADIGVSSPHLDNPDRGFSFMNDGPLDMRMDQSNGSSAADFINTATQEQIAKVLYDYGELKNSRSLATRIVQNRPFKTTNELATVIPGAYKQRMRILAQVFQALRIEVNDELGQLKSSLPLWHKLLNSGGRLAVISFHSLEDRIIKNYFQENGHDAYSSDLILITRKPLTANPDELVYNPRSRSAKLRAVQRK